MFSNDIRSNDLNPHQNKSRLLGMTKGWCVWAGDTGGRDHGASELHDSNIRQHEMEEQRRQKLRMALDIDPCRLTMRRLRHFRYAGSPYRRSADGDGDIRRTMRRNFVGCARIACKSPSTYAPRLSLHYTAQRPRGRGGEGEE